MSRFNTKKLFFVMANLDGGGAERVLSNIAQYLSQQDKSLKVSIVLLCQGEDFYTPEGCEIIRLNSSSVKAGAIKLWQLLRKEKPDAVISTLKHVTFITSLICRSLGIAHYSRIANTLSVETDKRPLWSVLSYLNYKLDRGVIAVSEGVKDDLVTHYNVSEKKIIVIPNPVNFVQDLDFAEPKIDQEPIELLFVGRFEPQKNIDFLLDLVEDNKGLFHLTLIGKGSLKDNIVAQIKEKNIEDKVTVLAPIRNIETAYKQADVFVLSSLFEGMPNVMLEALYFGLPVVSYDCPSGPREILTEDFLGALLGQLNKDAFARSIREQISSNSSDKARKRHNHIKANYNLDSTAKRYKKAALSHEEN